MDLSSFEGGTLTVEVTGVEGEGGQESNAGGRVASRAIIVGAGTGEISAPPATPLEPEVSAAGEDAVDGGDAGDGDDAGDDYDGY